MKIGVISDTHIPKRAKALPEVVLKVFKDLDHIIHAGDIMSIGVLNTLKELAPVTAVAGNLDSPELTESLAEKKLLRLGGFTFGIFHGHGKKGKTLDRAIQSFQGHKVDCIIFCHSHIPYCQNHGDILLFNPVSPTDKRRNIYYSFGIIEVNKTISPQLIYFDGEGKIIDI
ncbi:MAG TPA: YfcE family phosphodiesterase [Clostridium sp.]|jgi:putative phosphoesterase|nr:metallophosphoesterase family protein [Clostridia bacterium]HCW05279.1 YfcE family phosphodiesterase [Clostridium sp.]